MNWLVALMNVVPGVISGVTIDPEGPGSGGNDGYQQVINYIDQYRSTLGPANLQIGMTFGIDAKPMTFANLDTFPINSLYISPHTDPPVPSQYFPFTLPSYRNGNQAPLLNNVYLQAYEPDFSLIFTENLDPVTAANTFIQALQDIPYKTSYGTITTTSGQITGTYIDGGQFVSEGTITCTAGDHINPCTYSGSNFQMEIVVGAYLDYNDNGTIVPIGQVGKNPSPPDPDAKTFYFADTTNGPAITLNNKQFVLSQFGVEILSGAIINTLPSHTPSNTKIGAIDGPIPWNVGGYDPNQHLFTFDLATTHTLASQHFLGPEVVMKWTYPPITSAIAAGINFLFSVQYAPSTENLFFGNWTLSNYMAFVNNFLSGVSGETPKNPIFTDAGEGGVGLPSTNIGIYDYYLLLLTNANSAQNPTPPALPNPAPSPPNYWFLEFPPP